MATISDQIRAAVSAERQRGRSLNSLADQAGLNQSVLWRFMQGKEVRTDAVDRLADLFRMRLTKPRKVRP